MLDPGTASVELIRIAQQNLVLDLVESSTHPLGGTSLSGAIATLTQALANLPELAREAHALMPMMAGVTDHSRPIPDYEEGPELRLFSTASLPGPDDVVPLTIEPMTTADDPGFVPCIQANPNVPAWLKAEL